MILRLLILVSLGCLSAAGPIAWDDSKCAQKCNGGSKHQYSEDKTYMYSYESSNELQADKASDLSMHLKATVSLTVISKCEMVLQMSEVTLQHGSQSDSSSKLISQLQKHPLPFSWEDGLIEHVCPHPEDSDEVNNIKKAVLSSLQNTMRTFEFNTFNADTDILGTCDTEYKSIEKAPEKFEVTKTKNIPTCSNHLKGQTLLLAQFYPSSAHRQHLPFLSDEKSVCKQIINSGIIQEVTCEESAYFKPLADYGYVVKAIGSNKLKLQAEDSASRIAYSAPKKESLVLKYQPHAHKSENAEAEARSILQHICQNTEDLITKRAASNVHKLVYTIRQMNSEAVENVYTSLKNGEICNHKKAQTIFLDSLKMASSGGSISLLSKLVTSGEMSFIDSLLWTTIMPFTSYVEEESISAAVPLLEQNVANRQFLLGTSALAYKYCTVNPDCGSTQGIKDFSAKLKQLLGDKCHTENTEEETQMLAVLKAFGNLGYVGESGTAILDCANKPENKIEIRIAAVEAFRRAPCSDEITTKLLEIFSGKSGHDEVRMAALLSLSRCPSLGVMESVVETYNSETSRQVQVFTWSYLENVRSSMDPMKAQLAIYLSGASLREPDSTDITKFSRYFESSFFSELLNLGHVVEADIRHSSDSFLPRSGKLGLKLDIFGNQLDALTVGARVEDLEHILEKVFGPAGIFANIELQDLIQLLPENLRRNKRSSESYHAKIDALSERLSYNRNRIPRGTAFVRIMGHELGLVRLNEDSLKRVTDLKLVEDMLKKLASVKDIDASKNLLFVDVSVLFPSITGRAYKLASNGSLTLGFKADGKIDLRQSNFPRPRADIDGNFHPSILADVTAAFTIHSEDFEPGVKVETILNAGESFRAKIEIRERFVHLKLKRQNQRSEILSLKRTLYYMNDRGETEMPKPSSHQLNYCTKYLQKFLGAKYCASLTIPHLYENGKYKVPFVRAMEASLEVEETDPSMEGYEFLLEIPEIGNKQERNFKLLIDTPNSSEDRKLSIEINTKRPDDDSCSLSASFYSRLYSLDIKADMMDREDHLRFNVEATGDKRRQYAFNVDAPKTVKGALLVEYQPKIKLALPSRRPVEFTGKMTFSKGRKEQLSINLESRSFESPFTIKGHLSKEGESIDLRSNWKLNYGFNASAFSQIHRVHGTLGYVLDKGLLLDLGHHYEPDGRSYESVTVDAKIENIKIFDRLGFSIDSKILFAEHQDLNTMLKWDFSFKPLDHFRSDFIFRYGENFEDDTHLVRMTIASALKGDFNHFQKMNIENKIGLTISCLHFDRSASASATWDFIDQPKLIVEAGIKTQKDKEMKFEFNYRHIEAKPLKLATEMTITYNTYKFKYSDEANEIGPNEYKWESRIEPTPGRQITTDFIYRIKSSENFHHEIDGRIQFPGLPQPVRQKGLLQFTSTQLDFKSETDFGRGAFYLIDAQLKKGGKSEAKLKTPFIEGNLIIDTSSSSQNVRADFKTKDNRQLLITGNLIPGERTALELEVQWDPEKKVDVRVEIHKETEDGIEKHIITSSVNYIDSINVEISGRLSTDLIRGPHFFRAEFSGNMDPMAIEMDHQIQDGHMTSVTRYLRSGVEKLRLDMKGKLIRRGFSHFEIEFGTFLSSPYKSFDGKVVFFRVLADSNDNVRLFLSEYRVKFSPAIGYEGKVDYQRKRGWPGQITSNLIATIHNRPLYEGKAVADYGNGKYSVKASFTPISKKKTHFIASFEHAARFAAFHHSVVTNLNYIQTVELNAVADLRNFEDAKVQSNMGLNAHKLYDINATMKMRSSVDFDVEMTILSKITPSLRVISKTSQTSNTQTTKFDMNIDVDSNSIITGSGELKKRKRGFNGEIDFKYKDREILTLTINQDGKGKHERNYQIKLKFPSRLYTANIKTVRVDKGTVINYETKFCRNEELCFEIKATHKEIENGDEWDITYKRGDVEFSVERIRESSPNHERFHTVIYNGDHRYGYDIQAGAAETSGYFLSSGLILPSREIITKGTVEFSLSKPRLKVEFSADGKNHPERKLTTDLRFENHLWDNSPSKLSITITHPVFEKPIDVEISGDYEPKLSKYLTVDVSVDYSSNPDDKLLGSMSLERSHGTGNMLINLYHKDLEHLDFVIKANRVFTDNEMTLRLDYNWKGDNNVDQVAYMVYSYLKLENRFFFEYKRPKITYRLEGKLSSPASILNDTREFDLESTYNGETTKAKLVTNFGSGCHKLLIYDEEGEISRVIQLCISLRSRNIVTLLAESYDDEGHWTLDYLFQIVQKSWTTIGMRTQANPEFLGKYLFALTSLADELEQKGVGTIPFYDSPQFKSVRLSFNSKVLNPAKEFFIPEAVKFFKDVRSDLLFLREALINYYNKLPPFEVVKEKIQILRSYARSAALHVYSYYKDYIRKYHQYVDELISTVQEECRNNMVCASLVTAFKNEGWKGLLKEIRQQLIALPGKIDNFLENPSVDVDRYVKSITNVFKALFQPLAKYRCGELVIKAAKLSYERLYPRVQELMNRIPNYYKRVKDRISSDEYVKLACQLIKENYLKIREAVLRIDYQKLFVLAQKHLEHYLSTVSPPTVNRYITVNELTGEKGIVDISLHSNVFNRISNRIQSILRNLAKKSVQVGRYNWNTFLIKFKRGLDLNFFPPYETQAMIVGHQHFVTYDKAFYDFAGECTYLLTRDFEDANFTVALKPGEGNEAPSILVLKDHTSVELNSGQSSVKVEDNAVDLPYISKELLVVREGSTIIVNTKKGFQVKCSLVHEICTFVMSGWYFGKTAGLLGTYNYEDHDEFKRPKGQIANSVTVFAKSWELKRGCKTNNLATAPQISKNSDYYKQCTSLFEASTSPLSACFTEVSPREYLQLCLRLSAKDSNSKAFCNAAAAYVMECEENYVELNLPAKCLTCDAPDGSKLEHGDRQKFEKISQKSADVVFLVEDNDCNKVVMSDLGNLARSIEKELQNDGEYKDIMFGVVGFGGDTGSPKIFTGKDKVLFGQRDINSVAERFKLRSTKLETSRAFESIKLAVTHLFRSHTAKSLILLSCSPCKFDYTSLNYPIIQQILLERGISLHVIRSDEIQIRKSKEKNIIGMDADTVYHFKDVTQRDLVGERALRSQVTVPKDLCVALSQDVNGSFFSTHPISKASSNEVKNWRNVFARKFLKSSQLSQCQWCDCTATRDHIPQTVCQPCEIKRPRLPFSVGSSNVYTRTVESFLSFILHVTQD